MSTTRRIRFPPRLLTPLFLLIALTTGCQTTVGNYFGNRGRDFGVYIPAQVWLDVALSVFVKPAGPVHMTSLR